MEKQVIVFATNNKNKLSEVRAILGERFEIKSLGEIGCNEELPETHNTLEENALEKALYVRKHYGYDSFADDTGLEVDVLGGKPGVYSARYATMAEEGWTDAASCSSHDAEANMRKLLLMLGDEKNRTAQFKTVVSLIMNGKTYQFTGIVRGVITTERHGGEGFGYDPVFRPYQEDPDDTTPVTLLDRTFAEMTSEEKNNISHRGRAMQKLVGFLSQN